MFVFTSVSSAQRHPSVNQRRSWSLHIHLTLHPDTSNTVDSHCGSWMHCRLKVMQNLQQQNQKREISRLTAATWCHSESWNLFFTLIFKLWQYPLMLDNWGNYRNPAIHWGLELRLCSFSYLRSLKKKETCHWSLFWIFLLWMKSVSNSWRRPTLPLNLPKMFILIH